ncbi:MucBP domain-containing protein [Agrilactobacillus fermenti]|uniref:MucBP domain-containing protein n=1 Tax=Agrilactobacillus fermenti TaxID=2586909 RepID=UPI001E2C808C|nr:MucBP domain-containing protein [Agrilactobacillus fermenti]MCD2255199.1 MucBP domain-containing protein [Agrilactobacillus fermenti]
MVRTTNDLRKQYFKRKAQRLILKRAEQRHQQTNAASLPQPAVSNNASNVATLTETDTNIQRVIPKDIAVTIHYVDSLGKALLAPVTVYGQYKARLNIPWKTIPSYILASIHHFQKTFLPNPNGIYLIYAKQTAAPVVIYHRDTQGKLITPPEFLHGNLNSDYTIEPLWDMTQFVTDIQPTAQGTFTKNTEQVQVTYETMQLHPVKIAPDTYIQTYQLTAVFSEPDLDHHLDKPLPRYSTWRVYKAVQEKTNRTIWLNLGGSIWTLAKDVKIITQPKTNELTTPALPALNYEIINEVPVDQNLEISTSPQRPVVTWAYPYGQRLSQTYPNGATVSVVRQIQLDNYSLWAQLADGTYIESKYLAQN